MRGHIEGQPVAFAELVQAMDSEGWKDGERIKVAINDRGQIVITDGLHRAAAAYAVCLLPIPAEIVYRHEQWWALKYALMDLNDGVRLYQPIDHPDFASWPTWRSDTKARAKAIFVSLPKSRPLYGVDLGCNAGALTLALAREQIAMYGYDTDPRAVRVAQMIANMEHIGADEAYVSFYQSAEIPALLEVDFVVCLSLLNHYQAEPQRMAIGHAIFRACVKTAPLVFLDAPASGDPVGGNTEFVDPEAVFAWCAAAGVSGQGHVVAREDLQRPLLVWERGRDLTELVK
jgi:SAM-dependent methyltransferase